MADCLYSSRQAQRSAGPLSEPVLEQYLNLVITASLAFSSVCFLLLPSQSGVEPSMNMHLAELKTQSGLLPHSLFL